MKTKTTKLLVLLMAVVMQGFVSVSWGQEGESVGGNTNIINDLETLFLDGEYNKYNSVSKDLAISSYGDWNQFAEICNNYSNSDIQGAIKTVRIVGDITFGPNGNITIDTIPSGVTLSSEVSDGSGSGIHTISKTTMPLINVLEDTLKFVALDSSTIIANDGENGVYYYDTRNYKCFSPFVLCNKGKIYGCEVRNSTITIESLTNEYIHIGAIASSSPGLISNCIVKNNNLFDIANGTINGVKDISIGHVVGVGSDNNYNHGRVESCYCQITTEDHLFGSDMKNNCESSNISIYSNGVTGSGGYLENNVIAFIPGSNNVSFENAKSQAAYDENIRYLSPQAGSANNWAHYKSRSELQVEINKVLNDKVAKYLVRSEIPETVYINGTEVSVYPPMICPQQASMKKEYESDVIKSINSASEWNQMAKDYQYSSLDPAIEQIQIFDDLDFTGTIVRGIELPEGIILDGGGYKIYGEAKEYEYEEGDKTYTYSSPLVKINAGVIQNVFIDGLFIFSDNATTLNDAPCYSLLCGENNDTIQHCGVQNSKITVPNSDGTAHFGFLVAGNNGIVDHCYAACNGYALPDGLTSSSVVLSQLVAESEYATINESFAVDYDYNSISSNKLERYPLCRTSFNNMESPSVLSNNAVFLIDKGESLKETESHVFLSPNDNIYYQYTCSSEGVNDNNANSVKVYTSVAKLERYIKDYADNNNWVVNGQSMYFNNGPGGMAYNPYQKYSVKIDDTDVDFPSLDLKGTIVSDGDSSRLIRSAEDWKTLCTADRADVLTASSGKVILMNDIELYADEFNYTMSKIGQMCNDDETFVFEGNGHTITLYPKFENDNAVLYPLFDEIFPKATVRNLILLTNSQMGEVDNDTATTHNYGLLAQINNGTIESCAVLTQEIFRFSAQYSYTKEVTPNVYIGVMVGENKGTIKESFVANPSGYFEVSVSCVYNDSYSGEQTDLDRKLYVGGIVGKNSGSILDSYVKMGGIYIEAKETEIQNYISAISGQDSDSAKYERVFYNNDIDMFFLSSGTSYEPDDDSNVKEMYDSKGTENPESGDNLYGDNEKYRPFCYDLPTFIANFSNPMKWTYLKEEGMLTDEYVSNWPHLYTTYDDYNAPILTFSNLDAVIDEDIKVVDLELTDTTEVAEFTEALKNNPEVYSNAIVKLGNDIDYSNDEADADVPETLPSFNQLGGGDAPFNGTFDGSGHSIKNMTVRSDSNGSGGFFKNISESAVVKNLNIEGANIFVMNVDSMMTYSNGDENFEGVDTIYVAVFADKNKGVMSNCSFVGSIKVDEAIANSGKVIKICFVGENEQSEGSEDVVLDHAFIYLTDDTQEQQAADGNKVCIVIKQHIGAGRKSGRTRKTCSNKKSNKALVINPSKDEEDAVGLAVVNSEYREYTDEEFARGDVAFWLNYTQKGYSGEYSGEWKQGELYPVLDLNKTTPLVKLVYSLEGVDDKTGFGYTLYGNIGSMAKITYENKPTSISVNGKAVLPSAIGATSTSFEIPAIDYEEEPIVNVKVVYSDLTPIADDKDMTTKVTSEGNKIVISGASGETVSVISLRGVKMLDTEVSTDDYTVVIPQSGIYVVKVGEMTQKVVIK